MEKKDGGESRSRSGESGKRSKSDWPVLASRLCPVAMSISYWRRSSIAKLIDSLCICCKEENFKMVVTKFVMEGKVRNLFELLNCGAGRRTEVTAIYKQ